MRSTLGITTDLEVGWRKNETKYMANSLGVAGARTMHRRMEAAYDKMRKSIRHMQDALHIMAAYPEVGKMMERDLAKLDEGVTLCVEYLRLLQVALFERMMAKDLEDDQQEGEGNEE